MSTSDTIQDIYPLSSMQQGMLFHSIYAPDSGVYVEQLNFVLQGNMNIPAFEANSPLRDVSSALLRHDNFQERATRGTISPFQKANGRVPYRNPAAELLNFASD